MGRCLQKLKQPFLKIIAMSMMMRMLRFSNGTLLLHRVFFEEHKPYTVIDIPFCGKNENKYKRF